MAKKIEGGRKVIGSNKKAFHRYTILDRFEAGVVLVGTEVKSLRDGKLQLTEAYARFTRNELWLMGAHIAEYSHGNQQNHIPTRPRKLLMHKRELVKLKRKLEQKGFTLVPLSMYFLRGKVKVELGIGTGKNLFDKRQDLKQKDHKRAMDRAMRGRD